ncbi:ribosome biogenesis protein bms1-like isoform X2 [Pistacia vera]|uniref:ribosome biogenesis protein bms1-like isoform X2 n=1 Tax=Pistacia vera TaxID=55513 RepID=UPI001263095F|nr:ribosome biogenesis protein bms1-like isoform X2 [Pistacia vera]
MRNFSTNFRTLKMLNPSNDDEVELHGGHGQGIAQFGNQNAGFQPTQNGDNEKVFAFTPSVQAKRLQSQAVEKEQWRLHIPTIDRSYGEPPPYVVVGKSSVIKSLIKHYTKHNVPEV